jgi:hypothetical protein
MPVMRRRPLLRAAAISGGAYYAGKRRKDAREREYEEQAGIAQLQLQRQTSPTAPRP